MRPFSLRLDDESHRGHLGAIAAAGTIHQIRSIRGLIVARTFTLSAAYFYVISNITLIVTTLPFIAHDVSLTDLQRALLVSIFPLISLPGNLLIGPVADRLGRKRFLLVGSLSCAVLFVASSAVTYAWQAILLRGLTAVFMSMISCSIFSSIPDHFDRTQTLKVTGYVSAASSLAQLLAIPLTLLIAETAGWRWSFLALAVYAGLLSVMISRLPPPQFAAARTNQRGLISDLGQTLSVLRNRLLHRPLTGYALYSCGMFVFLSMYPSWLLTQGSSIETGYNVSLIFLAGGLGGLAGALFTGFVGGQLGSDRATRSVLAGLTATSVAALPFLGTMLAGQIAAYFLVCACRAILLPIVINFTMSIVPPDQRGSANGVLAAAFQTGTAIGGSIGAQLYVADRSFLANAAIAALLFLASALAFMTTSHPDLRCSSTRER
ncbi:MFS transporter [Bradyrhizobium sp. 21]|uniref:MFS transporter n=1 Tax=Bradyrhizobium sp. 21 TaxID=2782666 RepID=UPI001FF94C01|nr:MFS transporter [Bradyrhizobium sp. 21]MCK1384565.1 MFS transporter [Bradyrhizobium sp. 21]